MDSITSAILAGIVTWALQQGAPPWTIVATGCVLGLVAGIVRTIPTRSSVTIGGSLKSPTATIAPPSPPTTETVQPISSPPEGMQWTVTTSGDTEVWELDGGQPERRRDPGDEDEIVFLRRRLDEELRAKWQLQRLILDPPTARLAGRVARVEPHDPEATSRVIWLAIPDEGGNYQAIRIRGHVDDLGRPVEGDAVQLAATWRYGRLTAMELEEHTPSGEIAEPLPEVKLPDPKPKDQGTAKQDGKLPTMAELDKAAREGDWGSLSHSVFRFMVPVHITFSPKRRANVFAGRAAEVQAICREVAEAEGLAVIALAAEEDHLHLLGLPAGKGGCPPTWQWARWVGRFKALTSKRLKSLPGLEAFQWQTGYAICAVLGGRQGAEQALEVVRKYVEAQGTQETRHDDQEGASDDEVGREDAA